MPRLVALDLPAGEQIRSEVERAWGEGDVVLPLDQRMSPSVRRSLAVGLGADEIVTNQGREPILDRSSAELQPLLDGDALVIATSGTTGAPRGVVHTTASLGAHARMVGERLHLSTGDHWWLCIPVAHIGGFGVLARAMHHDSAISFGQRITTDSVVAARRKGATHTSVVPAVLRRHDFSEWSVVLVGGSQPGVLPPNAIATYGLTETCGGVVYDGVALPGCEIRVSDGRIMLRSPSLARTYRHSPLDIEDGWLVTGDHGSLEGSILRVYGRQDDLIITGGNKVWPNVVEQRLREHPLIADVAVCGTPDPEWGSVVSAWVVVRERCSPPTLEMLRHHVKETLASYCAPRRLTIVAELPRSTIGKILINELRALS